MQALRDVVGKDAVRMFKDDAHEWVNLARVCTICNRHVRGVNQVNLIKWFGFTHHVVAIRGVDKGKVLDDVEVEDQADGKRKFNATTMVIFVRLSDMEMSTGLRTLMFTGNRRRKASQPKARQWTESVVEDSQSYVGSGCPLFDIQNQGSLFSRILNLQLCGIYFTDFGTVTELSATMPLNQIDYPTEVFGSFRIGKLGYTEDFLNRIGDLRKTYGKFSSTISFLWMVLIPDEYVKQAEGRLKVLVFNDGFKLKFRKYNEFIIYDPICVQKLRNIYRRVGNEYKAVKPTNPTNSQALVEARADCQRAELLNQIIELKDMHTLDVNTIQELRTRIHQQDLELQALRNTM